MTRRDAIDQSDLCRIAKACRESRRPYGYDVRELGEFICLKALPGVQPVGLSYYDEWVIK